VDGAAFGTTFPHLFLMTFSNLVPDPLPTDSAYIPRVFGFRVHMSARQRTSGGSNTSSSSSASVTRQHQQERESNNANTAESKRRASTVGRRSSEGKDKIEQPAATASKGGTVTNASAPTSLSKQGTEEDGGAKKAKSGKRKNDNESGNSNSNSNNSNSKKSNGEKRRRNN